MRILLVWSSVLLLSSLALAQSPHGDKLKVDCSNCHVTESWSVISKTLRFDHDSTSFPLAGQHAEVSCRSCHKSLVFSDAKTECSSCHRDIHQNTLGQNCSRCHSATTWLVTNINRLHQATRFPLVGAHQNVDCAACHSGYAKSYFPPIDISCFSCHRQQYYATNSPNHIQSGFSTQCQDCHGITGVAWSGGNFDHSFFPLVGGHNIPNCSACHKQGSNFKGLSTACYSCHSADFANATNPNHVSGGFPQNCSQCHTVTTWATATFDHNALGFPLTNGHANLQCAQCHASGYTNTSPACYSCHQLNYQSAANPGHTTLSLPTDCSTCHTTNPGWTPATFPIHSNYYAIVGAHTPLTCDQCHNGNYNTAPATCYGCHQSEYNSTTNPAHSAAGFPTDCTQCHTQTAWSPSTFSHTQFPIGSGRHASPPLLCSQCHTNISNFSIFSCTTSGCHSQAETDPRHDGVNGYVYSATSCYTCHPTGGGGD
jgi:hypothetical protein